jgi:ubiquinone/menaquinone biosynthesis C-methylase UbiE
MADHEPGPMIELTAWSGPWADDDPDANFKADVALYAHGDPLRTLRGLSASTGVPVGALVRYVLARWASEGASGLLELGPTTTRRLHDVCQQALADGSEQARLAAFDQLARMISWLHFPLDHPEVYEQPIDRVHGARSLSGGPEVRAYYDRWAVSYDRDVYDALGFTGPDHVAAATVEHVDRQATVLDVGCGTGIVGERLAAHGFASIDGLDLSPAMLKVARHKVVNDVAVYRDLIEADLGARLPVDDGWYDAVVSAGTFVSGHVDAAALRELIRITRHNGTLVFTVADSHWEPGGFGAVLPKLVEDGEVEVIDVRSVDVTPDGSNTVRLVTLRRH